MTTTDPRLAGLARRINGRDRAGLRAAPPLQLLYGTVTATGAPLMVRFAADEEAIACDASDTASALPAGARVAVLVAGAGLRYAIGKVNP